ncbi:S8 family serine peptidase [Synechococcus sp. UW69]|uniref:S8 family serine peptidase n=1 Tax=Synechococcus sp. UW69 TaxID=368493 RepID=UPI00148327C4|nr:S8 family serine peptidase [Synechococcus sp. UW69]
MESSGQLDVGGRSQGRLERRGDRDWFSIDLDTGSSYSVDLRGQSLLDPHLRLRDSRGEILAEIDDTPTSLDPSVQFKVLQGGRFYLDVGSFQGLYRGSYSLSAQLLRPAEPRPQVKPRRTFSRLDGYGQVNAKGAFEALLNRPLIDQAPLGGELWNLDMIGAPEVWAARTDGTSTTGKGVTIAVVDTGIDYNHREFKGRIGAGYDFVDGDSIAEDANGHGTHVAGTIAAAKDGRGITGVAHDATIMPIRVLDQDGAGYLSDVIRGIRWATNNGADVINLSLGGAGYSQTMADAIRHASRRGTVVVMAAGNSEGASPEYPAAHSIEHGIAVGAVHRDGRLANFSNRAGSQPLDYVTAPGVGIASTLPGNRYGRFSGTSMAAPHVAGIAGLLKSHNSKLSSDAVEDLITGTTQGSSTTDGNQAGNQRTGPRSLGSRVITLDNIDSFSTEALTDPLIGSLSGNSKRRQATTRTMNRRIRRDQGNYAAIDNFTSLDKRDHLFASVDFNNAPVSDQRDLLRDLLANNHFDYFELDQVVQLDAVLA